MAHPLASADDLRELLADEDRRIERLILAMPVSWAAAARKHEGLVAAKARKAELVEEIAAREAGES